MRGFIQRVLLLSELHAIRCIQPWPSRAHSISLRAQQLKSAATKVNEAAITCLGLLGVGEFPHCFLEHIRDGLCRVAEIKSIEVQFSVGGALCSIGTGPLSLAARDKWYCGTVIILWHIFDPLFDPRFVG